MSHLSSPERAGYHYGAQRPSNMNDQVSAHHRSQPPPLSHNQLSSQLLHYQNEKACPSQSLRNVVPSQHQVAQPQYHHRYSLPQTQYPYNAGHRHSYSEETRQDYPYQAFTALRSNAHTPGMSYDASLRSHRPSIELPGSKQELPALPTMAHTTQQVYSMSQAAGSRPVVHSPDVTGQKAPAGMKPRVTATLWEDERSMCYQVEAKGICVARRDDNHMINGTKLLNVAGMTRGKRDGILKSEKTRHVVKIGPMHLKGVWIPFERALDFANKEKITDLLYPLFVHNIGQLLCHPEIDNQSARLRSYDEQHNPGFHPSTATPNESTSSTPTPVASSAYRSSRHGFKNSLSAITDHEASAPFVTNHPLSARPALERAHTFPTPPTSASGTLPGYHPNHSSYDWSTSLNAHGAPACIGQNASIHSTPATPATTPPRTTLPGDENRESQQVSDTNHTNLVNYHSRHPPGCGSRHSISPDTLSRQHGAARHEAERPSQQNGHADQHGESEASAVDSKTYVGLHAQQVPQLNTSGMSYSANGGPATASTFYVPDSGTTESASNLANDPSQAWNNNYASSTTARYHIPSEARSTLGPPANIDHAQNLTTYNLFPNPSYDTGVSMKRRREEASDEESEAPKSRKLSHGSASLACKFDERQFNQPRCLPSQPASVR